jgi:hypothetical protein
MGLLAAAMRDFGSGRDIRLFTGISTEKLKRRFNNSAWLCGVDRVVEIPTARFGP